MEPDKVRELDLYKEKRDDFWDQLALYPCPFCGSRRILVHWEEGADIWYVYCGNCYARGPEVDSSDLPPDDIDILFSLLIEEWSKRYKENDNE